MFENGITHARLKEARFLVAAGPYSLIYVTQRCS
jgi:hypothetical protein